MTDKVWTFPKARLAFRHLSEDEVWRAIDQPHSNPIEAEVTRLVVCFYNKYKNYIDANSLENLPPCIMHVSVTCPIEHVAVKIMVRYAETEAWEDGNMTCH